MINNFHAFLSRFLRLDNYDFVENSVKRDIPPSIQSPLSTRHLLQNPSFLSSLLLFLLTSLGHRVTFRFALTFISLAVSFARIAVAVTARKKKRRKNIEPSCPILTHLPREQRSSAAASSSLIFLSFLPILTGEMEEEEEEEQGCKRVTSRLEIMFQSERIGNRDVG